MTKRNGFATKADLRRLEKTMNLRFTKVDKRFEEVHKRFEEVHKRFEEVQDQILGVRDRIDMKFEFLAEDLFHRFTHEWQKKIDPILVEIEKHREKEVIWAEQNRKADKRIMKFEERLNAINLWVEERKKQEPMIAEQNRRIDERMMRFEKQNRRTQLILERIAEKVGVNAEKI